MIFVFLAFTLISFGNALHLQKRISSGNEVDMGEYPSVVAIRNRKTQKYVCVGSIIDAEWVLTSAECVVFNPSWNLEIMAGSTSKSRPSSYTQFRDVASYTFHEDFDLQGTHPNDIALLKLSSPLDLSGEFTKAAVLADNPLENWIWQSCTFAGWGGNEKECANNHENCEMWEGWGECDHNPRFMKVHCRKSCRLCNNIDKDDHDYLRNGKVTIIPRQDCTQIRLPLFSVNKQSVCGLSPDYSQGGCEDGDKGAPLFCARSDNTIVQLGVMSWSNELCNGGKPTIFLAVDKYIDWIREKTGLAL